MPFIKQVVNADPGNADTVGGDDWDLLDQYHDDIDLDPRIAKINTRTRFQHQKLQTINSANAIATINALGLGTSGICELGYNMERYVLYQDARDLHFKVKQGLSGKIDQDFADCDDAFGYICGIGAGNVVHIKEGTYNLANDFTGLKFSPNCYYLFSRGAKVNVPNGYTGKLWKFDDITTGSSFITVIGGDFSEQGTPQRLWNCYDFDAKPIGSGGGIAGITIRDSLISHCKKAFHLAITQANGYINHILVENIYITHPVIMAEWECVPGANTVFNYNEWNHVQCQAQDMTTNGFKDIMGDGNLFLNCGPADIPVTSCSGNIAPGGENVGGTNTMIIGGTVTFRNWADGSGDDDGTFIMDTWKGLVYRKKSIGYQYNDKKVLATAPSNPAVDFLREYPKVINSNNDGNFVKAKINGAITELAYYP